mgnify:CR=1 FL=1
MKTRSQRKPRPSDRMVWLGIFLLPVVIGVLFWADGCGHGDSLAYRSFIEATWREGSVPLARMEWYHPGQNLLAAPIFGFGEWLGLWSEPLRVCSLLNFLALGFAGATVFSAMKQLYLDRSRAVAIFAGLAVVTTPGWLWHSEQCMTDVAGHALILAWAARLLMHESRARTGDSDASARQTSTLLSWGFTGFLATYDIMIRVSSASFGLLFFYLWTRALIATPGKRERIGRSAALLVGGAVPVVAIFGHLIHTYGWTRFWSTYLQFSRDNIGMQVTYELLGERWLTSLQSGTGPVLFWAGLGGAAVLLLQMFRPSVRRIFTGRTPLFWVSVMLCLPYFIAVSRNRGWFEFRYMLPAMMLVSLACSAWAWLADRLLGPWGPRVLCLALITANLIHATPWLYVLGTRTPFVEVAAIETVRAAKPGSLLLGHVGAAHIKYRAKRDYAALSVRNDPKTDGVDFWNTTWQLARDILNNTYANGREAYFYNDYGLASFIEDLEKRGWTTQIVFERTFDGLRNARDENMARTDLDVALEPQLLQVMRLIAPENLEPRVRLQVHKDAAEGSPYELEISGEGLAGWEYRILVGKALTRTGQILPSSAQLPFDASDPLLEASKSADETSPDPIRRMVGKLDAQGKARVLLPASLSLHLSGARMSVLLHEPGSPWWMARYNTPPTLLP